MDSYQKLIGLLELDINKLKVQLEVAEEKYSEKTRETNDLKSQKELLSTNLKEFKYFYEVITNYKKITRYSRNCFIFNLIGRTIELGLLVWFSSALSINSTVLSILSAFMGSVIIGFTTMEYLNETKEERRIKKQYKKEDVIAYIQELETSVNHIDKKLDKTTGEEKNIKSHITNLNSELYLLNAELDAVKTKKTKALTKLINANEIAINEEYAIDQDLLKLERTLNNGKNI